MLLRREILVLNTTLIVLVSNLSRNKTFNLLYMFPLLTYRDHK